MIKDIEKIIYHIIVGTTIFLETILFCLFYRVDCLLSLGGVFYNGLAISLCSRLFGIISINRTAEDHRGVLSSQKMLSFSWYLKQFECLLTQVAFRNSSVFLTVGNHSLLMLEKQFSLTNKPCYALAGPVDYKVKNIYKRLQGYSCDSRIKDNNNLVDVW